MFSSNQVFSISGNLNQLSIIMKIFELLDSFNVSFDSYSYLEDGSLCFYNYGKDKQNAVSIERIDREPSYYHALVSLYLVSGRYKEAMLKTYNDCAGLDGSSHKGWKISVSNDGFSKKLVVEPYWCFYHK